MRRSDLAATAAVATVCAGLLCGVELDNLHNGLLALSFAIVGALVLRHRPGQQVAQLFVATGVAQALVFVGRQVGRARPGALGATATEWVAWAGVWPLPLVLVLVGLSIMRFPDGQLPGRRWRAITVATAIVGLALSFLSALWPVDYGRTGQQVAHPLSLPGTGTVEPLFRAAQPIAFGAFQVLWLVSVLVRRMRAGPAEARQLRWLLASVAASALALAAGLAVQGSPRAGLLTTPLMPVAAGIAIVEASYEALVREVRSAAKRVVEAEDRARRRIERDLHDGAQHRLVVLGMDLGRLVERADASGVDEIAREAGAARARLLEATAELRELARGIHPSILTQDGLVPAIESLADRSPIPVHLDVAGSLVCGPQTEITAYYVVSEALTNAARHSGASQSWVRMCTSGTTLHVDIEDDGRGGAVMHDGLRGIADRVVSVGGRFRLQSPVREGTRLSVELPCE